MAWMFPKSLARRETRLQAIAEAKERIRAREQQRVAEGQAAHDQKIAERAAHIRRADRKESPKGRKPKRPSRAMDSKAQINLTDEESRIMPSWRWIRSGVQCARSRSTAIRDCSLTLTSVNAPTDRTLLEAAVSGLKDVAA